MGSQRAVEDGGIMGPGLVNVVELASSIATYDARVAGEATQFLLPPEYILNEWLLECRYWPSTAASESAMS